MMMGVLAPTLTIVASLFTNFRKMSQASVTRYIKSRPVSSNYPSVDSFLGQADRTIRHLILSSRDYAGFHYLNKAGHIAQLLRTHSLKTI